MEVTGAFSTGTWHRKEPRSHDLWRAAVMKTRLFRGVGPGGENSLIHCATRGGHRGSSDHRSELF